MSILERLSKLAKDILQHILGIVSETAKFVLSIFFQFVPLTSLALWFKSKFPKAWAYFISIDLIKKSISRAAFRRFGSNTAPRPHAFTMAADYTTWNGLVDRSFTARHLGVDPEFGHRKRPDANRIVEMFMRGPDADTPGTQIDDLRSTLLFASFAQWFTDSFLRTSHAFKFNETNGTVEREKDGTPIRLEGREKKNDSNHEIDLCQIYGMNEDQTHLLRSHKDGCLKSQEGKDGEYPAFLLAQPPASKTERLSIHEEFEGLHPDERILRSIFLKAGGNEGGYETLFAAGLEHSNATIGNSLMNVIFLREHNRIAREIAKKHPEFQDEEIFQKTRNTMIVILLKIVISDYIRHISPLDLPLEFQPGLAENETWYRTNRIHIEFNILYRWHGLVPTRFSFMDEPDNPAAFRHNNKWLMDHGVAAAVTHFSKEKAGKMIIGNTPWFLRGVKQDTMRLMRAARLMPYNAYRKRFDLAEAKSFEDINDDPKTAAKLKELYEGKIEDVEWYVGMCAEKHGPNQILGDLMLQMVAHDAFTHALTNPLLSNAVFTENTFSPAGWEILNNTQSLKQIIERVVPADSKLHCSFSSSQ
ncbi:MAG: peroxidase family protein [Alphaproteobacteria bacterium]